MIYCKNCGVELENDMLDCPLCGEPVASNHQTDKIQSVASSIQQISPYGHRKMDQPQKRFTWEIVSIILLSGVMATLIIDFAMNRRITWSEYLAGFCFTIFSYVSLFAFWNQRTIIDMAGGFIASSTFILILDAIIGSFNWAIKLGIPLLLACNVVIATLLAAIQMSKHKGINLIAYSFIAAAFLCLCIEGTLSFFETNLFHLWWSLIVAACIFPIVVVLLFVHFRLRKGRSLHKTFHI
ncbi:DUF6320 domain-containing protein [Chitinophagaceae bacterium LB-8]|jgi:uncharacterized protein DUF6320|uniref:DUF6320 domain-containing protein n=1 Tax=Paraflavisolibacter caeni TaxID=2982496 RepID=A0A9X2XQ03_9BACT|nr:DUF6320 domain-containing protein [Paraflavisolibacter caeni]MCU7552643.1 DUF6320 domain-containing protein [Paraflavisolibacter caeni]